MRRIFVVALVGALMLVSGGVKAAEAVDKGPLTARCDFTRTGTTVVVTGEAHSPGALNVSLSCYLYVNGQLRGVASGSAPGSAVAVWGVFTAPPGSTRVCLDATSTEANGTTGRVSTC